KEYERYKGLVAANAATKQDLDNKIMARDVGEQQVRMSNATIGRMEAQIKQGDATLTMAKARVKSSLAAIETAKISLRYTEILSPIQGRAGQRLVDEGNVVTATDNNMVLVTIQRIDPIYVDFTIPERELAAVQTGMSAGRL